MIGLNELHDQICPNSTVEYPLIFSPSDIPPNFIPYNQYKESLCLKFNSNTTPFLLALGCKSKSHDKVINLGPVE